MAIDYPPVFINNYLAEKIPNTLSDYFSSDIMKFFPTQPTSIDTFTEEFPDSADEPFAVYDRMFRMRRKPFPHIRTEQLLYYFYKTTGGLDALIETVQLVQDLLDNGDESAVDVNAWIAEKLASSPGTPTTRETISVFKKERVSNVVTLTTGYTDIGGNVFGQSHGFRVGDTVVVSGVSASLNGTYQISEIPTSKTFSFTKAGADVLESMVSPVGSVGVAHPTVRFFDKDFFLPYFHEMKLYQLEEARDIIDFGTARTYAGNKMIIEYDWHKSSPL
jgi:hypothetical protein